MTALVDHARDHDLTAQGSQAARSRALTHLLEAPGLPTVSNWSIDSETQPLVGLIWAELGEGAEQQREKIRRWAQHLKAGITETPVAGRIEISTEGWAYGVRVRIQAPLRATAEQEAA